MESATLVERFHTRMEVEKSEGTADRYRGCVRRWSEYLRDEHDMALLDATTGEVSMYLRSLLSEDYAPDTVHVTRAAISQFHSAVEMMEEEGVDISPPEENPIEGLDISGWSALKKGTVKSQKLHEDVHYLTPEEKDRLVDNVPSPTLRNELVIRLLYQTGVRRGELTSIRLSDIDRDEREIQIRAEKTHGNRTVYYHPSLDSLFSLWIDGERNALLTADESPYLLPTHQSEQIVGYTIERVVKRAARDAGIQEELYTDKNGSRKMKVTPHTLRHSCAVQSLKNGIDVRTVQKLLGHAKIETTEQYLDIAKDDVKQKVRQFGAGTETT